MWVLRGSLRFCGFKRRRPGCRCPASAVVSVALIIACLATQSLNNPTAVLRKLGWKRPGGWSRARTFN